MKKIKRSLSFFLAFVMFLSVGFSQSFNTVKAAQTNILLGDFDQSKTVNPSDMNIFIQNYGKAYASTYDIAPAVKGSELWSDIYSLSTPDNKIDILDYITLKKNDGKVEPTTVVTPVSVVITGENEVEENKTTTLTAKVKYSDNTEKVEPVTWSSSNTAVATVDTTGKVIGVKEGTASITAKTSSVSGTFTITVKKEVAIPVSITITGGTEVEEQKNITLVATVKYSDNTEKKETVTWSSSNAAVATVDATGKVTGVSAGTANITAKFGDITSQPFAITVKKVNTGITIYVEKPTSWSGIWLWFESDKTTPAWDTTVLKTAPGDLIEHRTGWYKKNLPNATSVEFLFNDGTWNNKLNANGINAAGTTGNYIVTKSVWITQDGKAYDSDPWARPPVAEATPGTSTFLDTTTITLKVSGDDIEEAKYTLDGSDPEVGGIPFTNGQKITIGKDMTVDQSVTLKVYAKNKYGKDIKSYTYTKTNKVAKPHPFKLGAVYSSASTSFRIWSPDSADVKVVIDGKEYICKKIANFDGYTDIYEAVVEGDLHLKEYQFMITGKPVRDPYGVMVKYAAGAKKTYLEQNVSVTSDPGSNTNVVIDLSRTEPDGGWAERPKFMEREDAVLYEVHVKDFTMDPKSGVSSAKRGTYLGMVETGTKNGTVSTGIDHLKELGITHVQLMPVYDSATKFNHATNQDYNWGYDPVNFNIPEDRYSMTPGDYEARIKEFKNMVNEFHKNGIRVVMDVVYNHTFWDEMFQDISSKYYTGNNDSGCGNGINTGVPMVSRMIQDSLEFWATEYNIDGFRFDLVGIFHYDEVRKWGEYLNKQKYPDRKLLMYGEPWNGYWLNDPIERQKVRLGNVPAMASGHIGVFNPKFREAIKGSNDDGRKAYIFNYDTLAQSWLIEAGMRGSLKAQNNTNTLADLWDPLFAVDPEQTINYISAHDNYAIWDKIKVAGVTDDAYAQRILKFGMGIVLTAQGTPFLHAGDEMLRTKKVGSFASHAHNSYMWGDEINTIYWDLKVKNQAMVNYHKDLIAMRKEHPGFRMNTWDEINNSVKTRRDGSVVITEINAASKGDSWKKILIVVNPGNNYTVSLPSGTWTKGFDANGKVNVPGLSGTAVTEGTAVTVFYQQ